MVKKFTIPFASQGDANDIPDALQVDGKVSFTQGFGYDYERPYDDPQAKDIAREDMNGIFKAITSAVGELQTLGASEWSNAIAYPKGAIVYFEKDLYISQVDDNQDKPPQSWTSIKNIADDSLKKAMNLADLTDKNSARNNLGLGNSATLNKTDILGASSDLVATQKLVNDTKINLDNSVRAVDIKADKAQSSANNAQSTANTAVTKADNAQSRADSAYNLANSKWSPQATTGTGNIARMSEVDKKRDLTDGIFNTHVGINNSNLGVKSQTFYDADHIWNNKINGSYLFPSRGGTLALTSDIPAVANSLGTSTTLVASQSLVNSVSQQVASHGLGYGQQWVDVTSQRAVGTTYTNNTGKPIMIVTKGNGYDSAIYYAATINGVSVPMGGMVHSWAYQAQGSIIVPAGASYSISGIFNQWLELR